MKPLLNRFVRDESGATAIEYGLLASLIAVVIVATLRILGPRLDAKFVAVSNALQ